MSPEPEGIREVTAVVVTYNTRELALELIGDLERELGSFGAGDISDIGDIGDIVVVDNASTDGTADAIAAAFPCITLDRSATNLGFAAAVNRAARDVTTRWLLLVNPDARLDEGAVRTLVEVARARPGHGLYGGRFVDITRGTAEDSVAVLPSFAQLLGYATGFGPIARRLGWRSKPRRAAAATTPVEVDALPGCFVLIETDAWHEIGGFDEAFFMYGEDLDLSMRMTKAGHRPLYVPAASIRHAGGASSTSGRKEVLKLTSLVTLLRRQWSRPSAKAAELLLLAGVGLRRSARLRAGTPDGRWETAWQERQRWRRGW